MKIIEIKTNKNGGHRNQFTDDLINIPEGWAVIPEDMELENFPFGKLNYKTINGIKTVIKWEGLPIPQIEKNNVPSFDESLSKIEKVFETIIVRLGI